LGQYKYGIIIFWSNEDNCFIAEVPELPGCNAWGDTHDDVLKEIQTAMDL
jgi:predicted RNase H-like HicB family nuclease